MCPVDKFPGIAVEPVSDSSRYFLLRLQDPSGYSSLLPPSISSSTVILPLLYPPQCSSLPPPLLTPTYAPPFPSSSRSCVSPLSLNIPRFSPTLFCLLTLQVKMRLLVLDLKTEETPLTSMYLYKTTSSQFVRSKYQHCPTV